MDTEKKTAFLYLMSHTSIPSMGVGFYCSLENKKSCEYFSYVKIGECEVEFPSFSDAEKKMMMAGALLDSVIAERERYKAESVEKLAMLDNRIKELQCIEFKGGDNE